MEGDIHISEYLPEGFGTSAWIFLDSIGKLMQFSDSGIEWQISDAKMSDDSAALLSLMTVKSGTFLTLTIF